MHAGGSADSNPFRPEIELWFELETGCNLACRFCYNFWKDGSAPVPLRSSTQAAVSALRKLLGAVRCSQIAFSGGEPLLRQDLEEIIASISDYEVPVVVTTNGSFLTADRIRSLMGVGVRRYQVALHSHLAETHDMLSGGPSWNAALKAMILAREAGATVTPVFVATRLNMGHFPQTVLLAARLAMKRVVFNRFVPTGLGIRNRKDIGVPTDQELLPVLVEANAVARQHSMRIELGVPIAIPGGSIEGLTQSELTSCPVERGQRRWTLGSDLTLRRCNQSGNNIGSVMDNGLRELLSELEGVRDHGVPQQTGVRNCQILSGGLVAISQH